LPICRFPTNSTLMAVRIVASANGSPKSYSAAVAPSFHVVIKRDLREHLDARPESSDMTRYQPVDGQLRNRLHDKEELELQFGKRIFV
jgi:hypothetical protein